MMVQAIGEPSSRRRGLFLPVPLSCPGVDGWTTSVDMEASDGEGSVAGRLDGTVL